MASFIPPAKRQSSPAISALSAVLSGLLPTIPSTPIQNMASGYLSFIREPILVKLARTNTTLMTYGSTTLPSLQYFTISAFTKIKIKACGPRISVIWLLTTSCW
jgi:hypothetical protein